MAGYLRARDPSRPVRGRLAGPGLEERQQQRGSPLVPACCRRPVCAHRPNSFSARPSPPHPALHFKLRRCTMRAAAAAPPPPTSSAPCMRACTRSRSWPKSRVGAVVDVGGQVGPLEMKGCTTLLACCVRVPALIRPGRARQEGRTHLVASEPSCRTPASLGLAWRVRRIGWWYWY